MTSPRLPPTIQHALDLSHELTLLGCALTAERAYLDELADLVVRLASPYAMPASLALRMRRTTERVDDLVKQREAILTELAGHSRLGYSPNVLVRVYSPS